jgi:uncharacterized repeat protein (TIGR03803 family)
MQSKRFSPASTAVLAIFSVTLLVAGTSAAGQTEKVLHSFNPKAKDGSEPYTGLIFDAKGNLYGTTYSGGAYGYGTVFELIPKAGGGWTEKVLHSFNSNGKDGYSPLGGLTLDGSGNLYGTASQGGASNGGVAFELSPKAGGGWVEKILYGFGSTSSNPDAGLVRDASGNLYGTTFGGHGTVFELSPAGGGAWTVTTLYYFGGAGDAWGPVDGLIFDAAGNLYGTTRYGGNFINCYHNAGLGCGTVFELSPGVGGVWTEKVLYSFGDVGDGFYPDAGLVSDAAGNLYGTTPYGGTNTSCQDNVGMGCGIAFELSPGAGGVWTEKVLYNFGSSSNDGTLPYADLILDSSGNLYGTTQNTGVSFTFGYGTAFELSPGSGGVWTEKVLHNFGGKAGATPYGGLVRDSAGKLYGTTYGGGAYGNGTVFEITP